MANRVLLSLDTQKCFDTQKESQKEQSEAVFRTWFSAA